MAAVHLEWEWKVGLQTVISFLMLIAMCGGIFTFYSDLKQAEASVVELKSSVSTLQAGQNRAAIEQADTKAKVDLILPSLQRIEDRLFREQENRGK